MSFDICVWCAPIPENEKLALEIYSSLCDGDESVVEPCSRIANFVTDLQFRYPRLESISNDEGDEKGVWSTNPEIGAGYVSLTISFSKARVVSEYIIELADKHNLVVFDPQFGEFHRFPQLNQLSGGLL